jgi:hypothetical protein
VNKRHGPSPERFDVIADTHDERGGWRSGPELEKPDAKLGLWRTADSQWRWLCVPHSELHELCGK